MTERVWWDRIVAEKREQLSDALKHGTHASIEAAYLALEEAIIAKHEALAASMRISA